MSSSDDIRRACDRLRRLPAARWRSAPLQVLGEAASNEPSLQVQVRDAIARLMHADARARGVQPVVPEVGDFALPDVLWALTSSALASDDADAVRAVDAVAAAARRW